MTDHRDFCKPVGFHFLTVLLPKSDIVPVRKTCYLSLLEKFMLLGLSGKISGSGFHREVRIHSVLGLWFENQLEPAMAWGSPALKQHPGSPA